MTSPRAPADRLADVAALELGELLAVLLDQVGELGQASGRACRPPSSPSPCGPRTPSARPRPPGRRPRGRRAAPSRSTAPVAGLTTSNVWPSAASTASPPMTIRAVVGPALAAASGVCCSVVIGRGSSSGRWCGGRPRLVDRWYAERRHGPAAGDVWDAVKRPNRSPGVIATIVGVVLVIAGLTALVALQPAPASPTAAARHRAAVVPRPHRPMRGHRPLDLRRSSSRPVRPTPRLRRARWT